jgi:hypothetical protein
MLKLIQLKPFFLFVALFPVALLGATLPIKDNDHFPDVTPADLMRQYCPIDSGAHAFVIVDEGQMTIDIKETNMKTLRRHIRYQILNEADLDLGNFEILLNKKNDEGVMGLKATTYVMENGVLVEHAFSKKDILYVNQNEFVETAKIAMPAVGANCIIDIEYSIVGYVSAFVRPWHFQSKIPTLDSYYTFECSAELGFKPNITGSYKIESSIIKNGGLNKISLHGNNLPAFPELPYLTSTENYISKYEIEIFEYFPAYGPKITFSKTWTDVYNTLSESECFGLQLENKKFLGAVVADLKSKNLSRPDLLDAAIKTVRNKMSVEQIFNLCCSNDIETSWKNKYGNPTSINIILVVLLRELGFDANPLLLSTRGNGKVYIYRPTIENFNYVITYINLDGQNLVIDASSHSSDVNLLPAHCLNDAGLVFEKSMAKWITLDCNKTYKSNKQYSVQLGEGDILIGSITADYFDFGIVDYFNKIEGASSSVEISKKLEAETMGMHITSIDPPAMAGSESGAFRTKYDFTLNDKLTVQDNYLLFDCMLSLGTTENPLKEKTRSHPVEFLYPIKEVSSLVFIVPSGYKVEQLPKNVIFKTTSKEASYSFSVTHIENKIAISSVLNITEKYFTPEQYDELKRFFDAIISKNKEQIILSKL